MQNRLRALKMTLSIHWMTELASPLLRRATNQDREKISALVFEVLQEYGLSPDPCRTDADLADIERHYHIRGGIFDVLIAGDGQVVGSVGLYPVNDSTCELRKMYLRSSLRGKGLGRHLLEHALKRAKQLGFSRVTLETASVLKEAIALYQSYGFRPYAPDHLAGRCDQAHFLDLK
ncbi:MAG: GNAT family N-acetyltransferase [Verrucomicrobiota bacterium]